MAEYAVEEDDFIGFKDKSLKKFNWRHFMMNIYTFYHGVVPWIWMCNLENRVYYPDGIKSAFVYHNRIHIYRKPIGTAAFFVGISFAAARIITNLRGKAKRLFRRYMEHPPLSSWMVFDIYFQKCQKCRLRSTLYKENWRYERSSVTYSNKTPKIYLEWNDYS